MRWDESEPVFGDDEGEPGRESAGALLSAGVQRLGRDPWLLVPFAVAGVVLSLVDWLRAHDQIPTEFTPGLMDGTVSVAFRVYPAGVPESRLPMGALVDLKPGFLAWAVGLEALAVLAVGVAGWLTLSRAAGVERTLGGLRSYLALVVALRVLLPLFSIFDGLGLLVGLLGVAVALWMFVRLFAAPALAVAGDDVVTAVRRSARLSAGRGYTVAGLVVLVGLCGWLAGSVPVVGTFLSFAVVAPVHAVAVTAFVEQAA